MKFDPNDGYSLAFHDAPHSTSLWFIPFHSGSSHFTLVHPGSLYFTPSHTSQHTTEQHWLANIDFCPENPFIEFSPLIGRLPPFVDIRNNSFTIFIRTVEMKRLKTTAHNVSSGKKILCIVCQLRAQEVLSHPTGVDQMLSFVVWKKKRVLNVRSFYV